ISLRRAAVSSHASGLLGTPLRGQVSSAARNASARASSAVARSRERAARYASSLAYESRAAWSTASCVAGLTFRAADASDWGVLRRAYWFRLGSAAPNPT